MSRLPDGRYLAIFDGGPAKLSLPVPVDLPNKIGYSVSDDGLHWGPAVFDSGGKRSPSRERWD